MQKIRIVINYFLFSDVEGELPVGRSWSTFTLLPDQKLIVMHGGYSNEDHPLEDVWHLDLSEYYEEDKCGNGAAKAKWVCIRKTTINFHVNDDDEESVQHISPYRRFWHTGNLISNTILSYGGMNQNPTISGPCLNSLLVQQMEPQSLFETCLIHLQRMHLNDLPPVFSTFNVKRKLTILEELNRFKQRQNSFYLKENERHCPSLYYLSLEEIFNVLDLNIN